MKPTQLIMGLIILAAIVCTGRLANAQSPYTPATPTISPWFGLFERRPGPLGNYHSYVRPQFELQNYLQRQTTAIQQQNAGINVLGQRLQKAERGESLPATGTGSGFMNLSHYYSGGIAGAGGGGQTRQAASRRPMSLGTRGMVGGIGGLPSPSFGSGVY